MCTHIYSFPSLRNFYYTCYFTEENSSLNLHSTYLEFLENKEKKFEYLKLCVKKDSKFLNIIIIGKKKT